VRSLLASAWKGINKHLKENSKALNRVLAGNIHLGFQPNTRLNAPSFTSINSVELREGKLEILN
jgi:hypothetical protein